MLFQKILSIDYRTGALLAALLGNWTVYSIFMLIDLFLNFSFYISPVFF